MISKKMSWAGYILYALILTGILLYYRFPSDHFRDYFQSEGSFLNTGIKLSLTDVRPALPFGLVFNRPEMIYQGRTEKTLFHAENFYIGPELWPLLKGKLQFAFRGRAYRGDFKGKIRFEKYGLSGPIEAIIELKGFELDQFENLHDLIGRQVGGKIGGRITFRGQPHQPLDGAVKAELTIRDGSLEFVSLHPDLEFSSVDVKEGAFSMALDKGLLNLTRFELKGDSFQGTLTGKVFLRKELLKSRVEFKGTIKPSEEYLKQIESQREVFDFVKQRLRSGRLPFIVQGTLESPLVKFN